MIEKGVGHSFSDQRCAVSLPGNLTTIQMNMDIYILTL
jgi:hypothetical protein